MQPFLSLSQRISSEEEMRAMAKTFSAFIETGTILFLSGELGVGKTTFTRGLLNGWGYHDKVKSPTYALVEPYEINQRRIFHFDFYRVQNPSELTWIGIQDYFLPDHICIIEWPENAFGMLPLPDLKCKIEFVSSGRLLHIEACS